MSDEPKRITPTEAARRDTAQRAAMDELRAAIDNNRDALCDALGMRRDGSRYLCHLCQNDGHKHTDGDFSTKAGYKCHRCGFTGDGFALVQSVKNCDFPAAVAFVREVYGIPAPEKSTTKPKRKLPTWDTAEQAAKAFPSYSKKLRGGTVQQIYKCHEDDGTTPRGAEVRYLMPNTGKECRPFKFTEGRWKSGAPKTWTPYGANDLPEDGTIYLTEGPKCAAAMQAVGLVAVASFGGACGASKTDWSKLAGRDVVILPDADDAGEKFGSTAAAILTAQGCKVRILPLPGLAKGGDVADYLEAGGDPATIKALAADAPEWKPESEDKPGSTKQRRKPDIYIPDGKTTINDAAGKLGALLGERLDIFNRGGAIVRLIADDKGKPIITDVKPAALASLFESVARLRKETKEGDAPTTCPENMARLIMHAEPFRDALPRLSMLAPCPILTEHDGALVEVHGYDPKTGIYSNGAAPEDVPLADALPMLTEALEGFRFATPSDCSRALAAFITPALIFGGLLPGRAPIDLGEADSSQSGKGYRARLTTSIYDQKAKIITQKTAGVGGLEESLSIALIRGESFIGFDNVKNKVDSPAIESLTTEDNFTARAPYREPVDIDPRRVCIGMTSNKADLTKDLANRCSAVRILKQPDGHHFKEYPEGDILDHIRASQPRYLGAVFAVVKAWHAAGKPRTRETRHDFRGWAQTLDWIVQNIFDAPPLIDGHRETQNRMTNPALNWLRDVAIEVIRAKQSGAWLRAFDFLELLSETEIDIPGAPEHSDLDDESTRKKALQGIGRKLGICFRAGDTITIDGMTISRREGFEPEKSRTVREYCFEASPMDSNDYRGKNAANRGGNSEHDSSGEHEPEKMPVSPMVPPMESPMESPIKTLVSPNSPKGSEHIKGNDFEDINTLYKCSKGAIGGIGGNRGTEPARRDLFDAPKTPRVNPFTKPKTPTQLPAKKWSAPL